MDRLIKKLPDEIQANTLPFLLFTPRTNEELREAVKLWISDESEALKKYGHISYWETQYITDMSKLFFKTSFNEPLYWDTRKVTNMKGMFFDAILFNQPLNFTSTEKVTDMSDMFWNARSFNQPLDFNTKNVTDMCYMFCCAESFNQPLNFNTEKVTNMKHMFYRALSFNKPLDFTSTENVTNMSSMFDYCPISEDNKCSSTS